ncbi:MAG TPA: metallophosphoesterase [Gemmatimonadaceae bacterium]
MRLAAHALVIVFTCAACKPPEHKTTPPAHAPAAQVASSGARVMVGVGDIAECGDGGDEETAILVDSLLKADSAAGVTSIAFTLGDNAYPAGLDRDYVRCFGPSWGDPNKRIMKVLRPAIGNHDSQSSRGAAYYRYFGERAGPPSKGFYSYDIGDWHAVVLNSEIPIFYSRLDRARQEQWLIKDLRSSNKLCTVAYFHRPRFSSGAHGSSPAMQGLWKILAEHGVDLVLNGHDHHYERFLPMNAAGVLDTLNGMEQIIAGTGGGGMTGIRKNVAKNSEVQIQGHWGILIVTLGNGDYRTSFLDVNRRVWDPSGRKCH